MRRGTTLLLLLLLLLLSAAGAATAQGTARIAVDSYSLPNGLKVQLVEDHSSQVIAAHRR